MNRAKTMLGVLAFVLMTLGLSAFATPAVDWSGTWLGKTTIPNGTVDELTVVLKKDKTAYTGTVVDTLGLIAPDTLLKDVTVNNNEMTANFTLTDGTLIKFTLKIEGDKMNGKWEDLAEGSTGILEFVKKK